MTKKNEDCINREEALLALTGMNLPTDRDKLIALFTDRIQHLLPVTPQRPKGKWIYKNDNKLIASDMGYWQCSICEEGKLLYESAYCPNCGAEMSGGEEND